MKTNFYYYIDESGDLNPICNGGSDIFILGCIVTDSPSNLTSSILKLEAGLGLDSYYHRYIKNVDSEGFHASMNHPDIRAKYILNLHLQNFRSYLIVLDKRTTFYEALALDKSPKEIYDFMLEILLRNRLIKRKLDKNILVFEQNLPNNSNFHILTRQKELDDLFKNMNTALSKDFLVNTRIDIEIQVKDKKEYNLSSIDYINYIIYSALQPMHKFHATMKDNYKLFEKKIAYIFDLSRGIHYHPCQEPIDIEKLLFH